MSRVAVVVGLLAGCGEDVVDAPPEDYVATFAYVPDPPVAGAEAEVTLAITDEEGEPIPDLQASHERFAHVLMLSPDHQRLDHIHHEDFAVLGADDLRTSTFHMRWTPDRAGPWRTVVDFAHRGLFLHRKGAVDVVGEPVAGDPQWTYPSAAEDRDIRGTLSWDSPPFAGAEAWMHVDLATLDGQPVSDVVPWLGADGHAVFVSADLTNANHTHAWVEGMEDAPPGHEMPHSYDGPRITFLAELPDDGPHTIWVQFARAAAPDDPYLLRFEALVEG